MIYFFRKLKSTIMKTRIILFLSLLFLMTSCKQYYTTSNFEDLTSNHKTVAILPFEILTTGHVPRDLTPEIIEQIEENESKAFQVSFFNRLLRSTRRGKKPLRITLQHYSKTIEMLATNEIDIRASWDKDPEKLAKLLGVDAVVRGRIEKHQYFSDGLSAGIEIGSVILDVLTRGNGVGVGGINNKNVKTDYALVNAEDGTVLWSINYQHQADWSQQPDQMVDNINQRSSRHFPYRAD